jgi:hypothetical protein
MWEGVMNRRIVAVVTLVVFVAFTCSCYSMRMEPAAGLAGSRGRGADILAVITKGGETIEFDERYPGWVNQDRIEGYAPQPVEITLAKSQISRSLRSAGGRTTLVWTKDERKYDVNRVTADTADSLCFVAIERVPVTVPLADVDAVSVKRSNTVGTLAVVVIVSAVVLGVALGTATIETRRLPRNIWDY